MKQFLIVGMLATMVAISLVARAIPAQERQGGGRGERSGQRAGQGEGRGGQQAGRDRGERTRPGGGQGGGRRGEMARSETAQEIKRPIGLITNKPGAWPGYTLFAPKHFLWTYLMNNEGKMVNAWPSGYEPGQSVYLLPNGNLLHCCMTKGPGGIGGGEGGLLEEFDWDGNLVWEYKCSDSTKMMHHDVEPLANGNILAMIVEKKTREECVAAGFSPNSLRDNYLLPEYIVELKKKGKDQAEIVWEWHVWDHLIQQSDLSKANYGDPSKHPERISVDVNGRTVQAFWNHMNSLDYNPELDQIMLSVRGCSELWVIDHSTTTEEAKGNSGGRSGKGGGLLYRWGNPAAYGQGDAKDQMLFQQHDAQWIEPGLPGAGNILIFNNGLNRVPGERGVADRRRGSGYSSVDEIVPPIDAKSNYALSANGAFGPTKLQWTYVAPNPTEFYAEAISGAQRLPNGNTLVCDGTSGVFFEVTPKGEKVWEYVCPVDGDGPMKQGDAIPIDQRGHAMNAVFKIHRYPADYPGLAGKDLKPKELVTGSTPPFVPENLTKSRGGRGGQGDQGGARQNSERRGNRRGLINRNRD